MNKRTLRYKLEYTGKTFNTNSCDSCTIVNFENSSNVTVEFKDYPCKVKTTLTALRSGKLLNPMYPTCSGVGYLGVGKHVASDKKVYWLWYGMLQRVYDPPNIRLSRMYKDVEVCEEWKCFQNFAAWCYGQKFFNSKGDNGRKYHLDKDLLSSEGKVYSPNTCCFVPHEINSLVQKNHSKSENSLVGMSYKKLYNSFEASIKIFGKKVNLGSYKKPEDAFEAYKMAKEQHIKVVAEKWRGKIEDEVYDLLINYQIKNKDS